jgi:hypothetical protein
LFSASAGLFPQWAVFFSEISYHPCENGKVHYKQIIRHKDDFKADSSIAEKPTGKNKKIKENLYSQDNGIKRE